MINKSLENGDMFAIKFRRGNDRIGYDAGDVGEIYISVNPCFWIYKNNYDLAAYIPLDEQKELYDTYGVDCIEIEKSIGVENGTGRRKQTYRTMMVQQYYIDPVKKNLGVIEFIRVKHSDF